MAAVILDASVVIAFLDANDVHHDQAVTAFANCQTNELVIPASVYAEILVGPYRRGSEAVAALEQFLVDFAVRIESISAEIARRAALLRSQQASLRLPDALVLATGDILDAMTVLTADTAWAKISSRVRVI
ncbi:MAG TPA: PIN domain-containing protein [Chloroflexota bacterium]|nr:PIN domain-containing protein [Chloroflexota bacterium]